MKRTVFLGTYTKGESKGIYSCRFDDASGMLSDFRLAAETPSPSFLALHPNGKFLYAVNETNDEFEDARDRETQDSTLLEREWLPEEEFDVQGPLSRIFSPE